MRSQQNRIAIFTDELEAFRGKVPTLTGAVIIGDNGAVLLGESEMYTAGEQIAPPLAAAPASEDDESTAAAPEVAPGGAWLAPVTGGSTARTTIVGLITWPVATSKLAINACVPCPSYSNSTNFTLPGAGG
jgi:hypothetical protein